MRPSLSFIALLIFLNANVFDGPLTALAKKSTKKDKQKSSKAPTKGASKKASTSKGKTGGKKAKKSKKVDDEVEIDIDVTGEATKKKKKVKKQPRPTVETILWQAGVNTTLPVLEASQIFMPEEVSKVTWLEFSHIAGSFRAYKVHHFVCAVRYHDIRSRTTRQDMNAVLIALVMNRLFNS